MPLKKIKLDLQDKEVLEELTGLDLQLRNNFGLNHEAVEHLLLQGRQNALVYLDRNRLGQKLSLFEENNLFVNLVELKNILGLKKIPRRMECYDISHLSGTFVYGSMVTFLDGQPAKNFYRLFKCPSRNDDYANHREVLQRRLKRFLQFEETRATQQQNQTEQTDEFSELIQIDESFEKKGDKKDNPWQLPDLIIVDGGKGQLAADYQVLQEFGLENEIEIVSLAKNEEEIFTVRDL